MNPMRTPLVIDTFDDLRRHEATIVERIGMHPRGGELFLVDPLRLLADVGVVLGDAAVESLAARVPGIQDRSERVYEAAKRAQSSPITVTVRRLFGRDCA